MGDLSWSYAGGTVKVKTGLEWEGAGVGGEETHDSFPGFAYGVKREMSVMEGFWLYFYLCLKIEET